MTESIDLADRFAAYLGGLASREERAALAALRRGLGRPPGEATEAYRYVVPFTGALEPRREDAFFLAAALFAWHPRSWDGPNGGPRNLGASFARLRARTNSAGAEQRLVALLNSHAEDLPARLRQAVGLLRAHEVGVDWAQLIRDVERWGRPDRRVQRDWSRAYWGTPSAEPDSDPTTTTEQA